LKNIRDASLEELSAAPGLPEGAARNLHAFLHPEGDA
jgi:hypothetical protein